MQIRGFIAASLDGYIARADGAIDWLDEFGDVDYGYERFIEQVGTIVIGRRTYDQVLGFGDWVYQGLRTIVVSHRPVDDPPPDTEVWSGDISDLVAELRRSETRDVWVIGGADVQRQFLDAGGLDRIEVHVIPVLLGRGIPLWPPSELEHRVALNSATVLGKGMVRLDYGIRRPG